MLASGDPLMGRVRIRQRLNRDTHTAFPVSSVAARPRTAFSVRRMKRVRGSVEQCARTGATPLGLTVRLVGARLERAPRRGAHPTNSPHVGVAATHRRLTVHRLSEAEPRSDAGNAYSDGTPTQAGRRGRGDPSLRPRRLHRSREGRRTGWVRFPLATPPDPCAASSNRERVGRHCALLERAPPDRRTVGSPLRSVSTFPSSSRRGLLHRPPRRTSEN